LFQTEPVPPDVDPSARFAERYDRWLATSMYPRVLKEFYVARRIEAGDFRLRRFDPASRSLHDAEWPASMADWRSRLNDKTERREGDAALFIRRLPPPVWESVPALVVPSPTFIVRDDAVPRAFSAPEFSYSVLTLDLAYITSELLPDLTRRHFRTSGEVSDYRVAVVENDHPDRVIYRSSESFWPAQDAAADASATLFQIRTQDFGSVAAEVRRFATFSGTARIERDERIEALRERLTMHQPAQLSILVQQGGPIAGTVSDNRDVRRVAPPARWRVTVKHPAGSLEAAVGSTRRRNLLVSSSILAVLGASMALLIVSTRRSQNLARQQLEFVAAVSHELRTPLAVIRSAGENLADGVVSDEEQIRKYGELIRGEGRRLTDMVEQILEFSGIQSGQRGFSLRPLDVSSVVQEVLGASASLIEEGRMRVDVDIPDNLPPIAADEPAFRRVLQNLISNAIKYGASGGWIGIKARADGGQVIVAVSDKGIGIPPAQQTLIFEPFYRAPEVVAARIQGAGLGLSLVRRIVEGHNGEITVRSTRGQGSEFSVSMPVADRHASDHVAASASTAEPAQSS
jgi:signal transduction histidine kinase